MYTACGMGRLSPEACSRILSVQDPESLYVLNDSAISGASSIPPYCPHPEQSQIVEIPT